jgi:hypothetical protein
MRQILTRHPDSRCDAVDQIAVEVERQRGRLTLNYRVTGRIADLRVPSVRQPLRIDELWRFTCLEAFLRAGAEEAYLEFNFSPSTAWAAYRFESYREGMSSADAALALEVSSGSGVFRMRAVLNRLPSDDPWHLGLAAVMEEKSGRKSYWALAHPPGKPDFHHADGFALEIPGA